MRILRRIYKSKPVKIARHLILAVLLVGFLLLIVVLPYRVSLAVGRVLGWLVCYLTPRYRKKTEENLILAFPEKSINEIKTIRDRVFMNMGMNVIEFGIMNFRSKKFWTKYIDTEGIEYLKNAVKNKPGVVFLTAHIGNWELLGGYLAMEGMPVTVVARKLDDDRLNWLLVKLRSLRNVQLIFRTPENTRKMFRLIKKGGTLAFLIDQDIDAGGIFVDFFGRKAYTPTAVSQFARIKDSVILPGFIYRKKDYTHQIKIMKPVEGGKDINAETQLYTNIIEKFIREHPAQWVWMHPRWKRKAV